MSKLAVPLAGLMFATWAVYLGGLASLQQQCSDDGTANLAVTGVDSALPCHKVYRLYWFYMAFEIFVIVAIAAAAVTGKLAHATQSLVALLAVGLVLFIQTSNTFLTAQDQPYYDDGGAPQNRIRTITAGAIMVATMNGIAILVLGGLCGEPATADKEVAEKAAPVQTA